MAGYINQIRHLCEAQQAMLGLYGLIVKALETGSYIADTGERIFHTAEEREKIISLKMKVHAVLAQDGIRVTS